MANVVAMANPVILVKEGNQEKQIVLTDLDRVEIQFVAIKLAWSMVKHNPEWIGEQPLLVNTLKALWNQDAYHARHNSMTAGTNPPQAANQQQQQPGQQQPLVDYTHWKEPKIIVKILLAYFKQHQTTEILLLFQLLRYTEPDLRKGVVSGGNNRPKRILTIISLVAELFVAVAGKRAGHPS